MDTYFRIDPKKDDPERLLDPENQESEPWSGTVKGRCDKCGGSGQTEYDCESCQGPSGPDEACEVCHGKVTYVGECPACEGTGEIDDSSREGVSVFPELDGLYRYMLSRDADLDGCQVVELEGEPSEDEDFDADEGALLIRPTQVVRTAEIDRERLERLKKEAA